MKKNVKDIFGILAIAVLIALWLTNADWLILFAFFFVASYVTFTIIDFLTINIHGRLINETTKK